MSDLSKRLKDFFETNSLALAATSSLKNDREIEIQVSGQVFTFKKVKGVNAFNLGQATDPDFIFLITEKTAADFVEQKFENIAQVGIYLLEKVFAKEPADKMQVRIRAGLMSLVMGGYLGVLSSGGADIMKYLGTHGFGSLSKIKEVLTQKKDKEKR